MRVIAIGNWFGYMLVVLLGTSQAFAQFKITHSNKCSSTETYFRILYEQSLKECVFECDIRPKCKAVNYRHRRQQCELLQTDNPLSFEPTTEQTGPCVYIKKKHISMDSSACCDNNCKEGQACNTNTGICDIKECPRFLLPSGTIWGNMYRVGSRLKTHCDTGFKEPKNDTYTTCNTSGHWDPDIQCIPGIVDCGPPPDAHVYGTKVETGTTFGASVTYRCNTTYTPNMTTTATCKADGNWNITSVPTCSPADCQNRHNRSIDDLNTREDGKAVSVIGNTRPKSGKEEFVYLTDHEAVNVNVENKTSILFSVQAKNEVHIVLSCTNNTENFKGYEIVLGGWAKQYSAIRKDINDSDKMEFVKVNPLKDKQPVLLWISWKDFVIAVGTGSYVGCSAIMELKDPEKKASGEVHCCSRLVE